jgi:shikimate dehydrogenase
MMKQSQVDPAHKKVLVLGTGGAAQAIVAALHMGQAAQVVSVSRTGKGDAITYEDCIKNHTDARIIVNTTPVGMFPHADASPLDLTPFHSCEAVLDVIYNPAETKLTAQARSLGMKAATGLTMLVAQAKYACELFLGEALPDSLITEIVEELQNV